MKSDRLQGILASHQSPKPKRRGPLLRQIQAKGLINYYRKDTKLERKFIELKNDYAELIAADLLDRFRRRQR